MSSVTKADAWVICQEESSNFQFLFSTVCHGTQIQVCMVLWSCWSHPSPATPWPQLWAYRRLNRWSDDTWPPSSKPSSFQQGTQSTIIQRPHWTTLTNRHKRRSSFDETRSTSLTRFIHFFELHRGSSHSNQFFPRQGVFLTEFTSREQKRNHTTPSLHTIQLI